MCDSTRGILPTREVHPGLGVQSPYWSSRVNCPCGWPQSLNLLEVELILYDSKAPHHQHIARHSSAVQNPRSTNAPLIGRAFQRLRNYPPGGEGKGQPSYWSMLKFSLHMQKCFLLDKLANTSLFFFFF